MIDRFRANIGNMDASWHGVAATLLVVLLLLGTLIGLIGLFAYWPWVGLAVVIAIAAALAWIGST